MSFRRHYNILSERYFDCMVGDLTGLLWTIGQAPLIALLIILRWDSWQATDTLHFILALSVHWFGLINACREIAKERSIYDRERLFDLSVAAYLFSKVKILSLIGFAEILAFFMILRGNVDLSLNPLLAFSIMYILYLAGMAVGLLLSAVATTPGKAVIGVPLLILPQIIFSQFILPAESMSETAEWIEKATPVKWGYEALRSVISGEVVWGDYFFNVSVLAAGTLLFVGLTLPYLKIFR